MVSTNKSQLSISISFREIIEGFFGIRREENPSYVVLVKEGAYEIREYDGYICAQVVVKGSDKSSVRTAFMKLARYIFGANKKKKVLPMTAPVLKASLSETIPMTAPVLMQNAPEDTLRMSFIMPKKYSLDELPTPNDESITFKIVEKHRAAVLTYSGRSNPNKEKKRGLELEAWLNQKKTFVAADDAFFAGYDPPWTISFRRKNEIIIPLKT